MPATTLTSRTKSRQGCWTCKGWWLRLSQQLGLSNSLSNEPLARKVQCDQGVPTCKRCATAHRECEGYGLRLSWPRDNDRKRAQRADLPTTSTQAQLRYKDGNPLINTTFQDIEFYQYLSLPGVPKPPSLTPSSSKLWRSPQSEVPHAELLYYCEKTLLNSIDEHGVY